MHRGHDHHHHDHELNGAGWGSGGLGGGDRGTPHGAPLPARGHNRAGATVTQWQTPHRQNGAEPHQQPQSEPDLDQVELAFVEGFASATDPTSFLRLANIPFEATADSGETLALLRLETDMVVDVGSVMPHLGGASFRYDPLPGAMATKRRQLRFVYFAGNKLRTLTFAEARKLSSRA